MTVMQKVPSSTNLYAEHPLNHNDNIRLIRLSPRADPQEITRQIAVELKAVPFQQAPQYTALSYVWGPPQDTRTIHISGHPVQVRANLWDFLSNISQSDSVEYIWVDALCIDQSSNAERNHQVALMGQIYSRASKIVAWLGAGPPELVHSFGQLALMQPAETVKQFDCNRALIRRYGQTFRDASYWRRAWIVQEYVLARAVEFWCGPERMGAEVHELCARMLWNTVLDSATGILELVRLRQARQTRQDAPKDVDEVLKGLSMQLRKCADVRDRVYAVLSLVDPEALEKFPIAVDYNLSPSALHTKLLARHKKQLEQNPEGFVDAAEFSALILEVLDLPRSRETTVAPPRRPVLRTTPDEIITYSARRHAQSMNLYHTCHH